VNLRNATFLALGAALPWLAGCGVYSTTSGRIDDAIRPVAVPYLENLTAEPNIEVELTENIISALQDDNTLRVVATGDAATELTGKVVRYNLREAFTTSDLQVDEYQVQIMVELTLRVLATGETLFEKKRITGTGNFAVDEAGGSGEAEARAYAAAEIVREVVASVVEDW
jgi:hypothetical protein